jgi:hypothetical protein
MAFQPRSGALLVTFALAACGGADAAEVDASAPDAPGLADGPLQIVDDDGDGLDDAWEQATAAAYLPFLSLDPTDGCARGGIVFRLRSHPANPALIFILYDHLFENDCGLNGHVGDNEAFGVTVDPMVAPPGGIVAMKAISHQGTPCQRITECGSCSGLNACETQTLGGMAWPVVYSSKDKHGGYVAETSCDVGFCLDSCVKATTPDVPPLVNAGEPAGHLTENLTSGGFITAANGWTEAQLLDYDPWGTVDFGSAGLVADDLIDPEFEAAACP